VIAGSIKLHRPASFEAPLPGAPQDEEVSALAAFLMLRCEPEASLEARMTVHADVRAGDPT
jgi:hypothetical protein